MKATCLAYGVRWTITKSPSGHQCHPDLGARAHRCGLLVSATRQCSTKLIGRSAFCSEILGLRVTLTGMSMASAQNPLYRRHSWYAPSGPRSRGCDGRAVACLAAKHRPDGRTINPRPDQDGWTNRSATVCRCNGELDDWKNATIGFGPPYTNTQSDAGLSDTNKLVSLPLGLQQ